jgi:hypothetical protein
MFVIEEPIERNHLIKTWWAQKRLKYNIGLILAGIIAFLLYAILGSILIVPHDPDFEITLFTIAFQGFGYFIMILIANLFYYLGPLTDRLINKDNSEKFRKNLYNLGFCFSVGLPFLIPIIIVIQYFLLYAK